MFVVCRLTRQSYIFFLTYARLLMCITKKYAAEHKKKVLDFGRAPFYKSYTLIPWMEMRPIRVTLFNKNE